MSCPTDIKTQVETLDPSLTPKDKNFRQTMKNTLPGDMATKEALHSTISPEIPRSPTKAKIQRSSFKLVPPVSNDLVSERAVKLVDLAKKRTLETGQTDPLIGALKNMSASERLTAIGNDIRLGQSIQNITGKTPDIYLTKAATGFPKGYKPSNIQVSGLKTLLRDIKKLQDKGEFNTAADVESLFSAMMPTRKDQMDVAKIMGSHIVENAGPGEVRLSGIDGPPNGNGPSFIPDGPIDPPSGGSLTQRDTSRFIWALNKILRPVSFLESVGRELGDKELPALGYAALDGANRKSSFTIKYLSKFNAIRKQTPNADPEVVFGLLNGQFLRNEVKDLIDPLTNTAQKRLVTVADESIKLRVKPDDIRRAKMLREEIFIPAMDEAASYSGFNLRRTDSVFTHVTDIMNFLNIQKMPNELEMVLRKKNNPLPKDLTPRFFKIPENGYLPFTDADTLAEIAIRSYSSAYMRSAVQQANRLLNDQVNPLSQSLRDYITDYMARSLGAKDRIPAALGAIRFANYATHIAGSLSFPVLNTLQLSHTFAKVGSANLVKGIQGAIRFAKGGAEESKFVKDLGSIPGDVSGKFLDEIREFGRMGDSKLWRGYELTADKLGILANKSERMIRLITAFSGREAGIKQGLEGKALVDYVNNEVIRKTQYFFNVADRAPVMANPLVGTAFQFQNFNLNTMEFITRDLVMDSLIRNKDPMPLIRYAGFFTALAGPGGIPLIGEFFGPDIQDSFPSIGKMIGIDFASRTTLPITLALHKGILPDINKGFMPISPMTQRFFNIMKYFLYEKGSQEEQDALKELTRSGINVLPVIPGGLQLERIRKAIMDVGNDFKRLTNDKSTILGVTSPSAVTKRAFGFQDYMESLSREYLRDLENAVYKGDTPSSTTALQKLQVLGIERASIGMAISRGRQRAERIRERSRSRSE